MKARSYPVAMIEEVQKDAKAFLPKITQERQRENVRFDANSKTQLWRAMCFLRTELVRKT